MDKNELLVKVCGITDAANAEEIAMLQPNMMGFILYPKSSRYIDFLKAKEIIALLPKGIKKVAVLVNEPLHRAKQIADSRTFDILQLHGNESIEYCQSLATRIPIMKAFGVVDQLPAELEAYSRCCTYFLFDTKSENYGGSGQKFNHEILKQYSNNLEFLISGGIDLDDIDSIIGLKHEKLKGIDINSKFEEIAGIKDVNKVKKLIKKIKQCTRK
ncbi:phosphoribosylanthranilate isomerase [Alistipes sp. ZOR0009]|uniref:phosphoribosylanthranilate isomerase n=1 Tax=Alistipes sp. ZOR0009 TaxID=1339253 RepID=UPI0006469993|nr:phosphoribosylanthranilate isomerase [Alistipes sp. ZOR0009]